MTQILKSTVPINAHFENNILLCIKSLKVQKSCLPSPAPTYEKSRRDIQNHLWNSNIHIRKSRQGVSPFILPYDSKGRSERNTVVNFCNCSSSKILASWKVTENIKLNLINPFFYHMKSSINYTVKASLLIHRLRTRACSKVILSLNPKWQYTIAHPHHLLVAGRDDLHILAKSFIHICKTLRVCE